MKIVSLLPSATEIVYALGLDDQLAAVTFECDHPSEARHKPVASRPLMELDGLPASDIDRLVAEKMDAGEPLYSLDADLIRSLQPDLILAQDLCRVCAVPSGQVNDALEVLGCRAEVLSLDPSSIEEVIGTVESVAAAAGIPTEGTKIAGDLRARVEAVRGRTADIEPVACLALEWADPPFIGGHWVPEMIEVAGGRDVLGSPGARSARVTWDDIGPAGPEVVVFMPCGFGLEDAVEQCRALFDVGAFASLPAARAERVYAVDASAYFSRPGPRIVDGLEIVAWCLAPDAFPEPPPGRAVRVTR